MPLIGHAALFAFTVSVLLPAPSPAEAPEVRFYTSPPVREIRPRSGPVAITISVSAGDNKPVGRGRLRIRLDAPAPGWLFSTDFPWLEGSQLLQMELPIALGKAEWRYDFPIRGRYVLVVEFFSDGGTVTRKTFHFTVRERRTKLIYLGGFLAGLFFFGFAAGRLFTRADRSAHAKVGLVAVVFLSFLVLWEPKAIAGEIEQERYRAGLEADEFTVGRPGRIRWFLQDRATGAFRPSILSLTVTHLEEGKTVFSLPAILVGGDFSIGFQFTDGSNYRIAATAELEDGVFLRRERDVSVVAPEPPARSLLPALFLFLAAIAFGLVIGRWSRWLARHATNHG